MNIWNRSTNPEGFQAYARVFPQCPYDGTNAATVATTRARKVTEEIKADIRTHRLEVNEFAALYGIHRNTVQVYW